MHELSVMYIYKEYLKDIIEFWLVLITFKREVYLWEHGTLGVVVTDTVQAVNIAISIKGIIKEELIQTLLRKQKNFMPL